MGVYSCTYIANFETDINNYCEPRIKKNNQTITERPAKTNDRKEK